MRLNGQRLPSPSRNRCQPKHDTATMYPMPWAPWPLACGQHAYVPVHRIAMATACGTRGALGLVAHWPADHGPEPLPTEHADGTGGPVAGGLWAWKPACRRHGHWPAAVRGRQHPARTRMGAACCPVLPVRGTRAQEDMGYEQAHQAALRASGTGAVDNLWDPCLLDGYLSTWASLFSGRRRFSHAANE